MPNVLEFNRSASFGKPILPAQCGILAVYTRGVCS